MTRAIDGRLLLKLAAQVEELQARVTELEGAQRINALTIARHAEAIETIAEALNAEDDEEGAMIQ
jgi:hypothetical protein